MKSTPDSRPVPPSGFCAAILEQAPYGIVVCRANGEIIFANNLATFLLQREAVGNNLRTIIAENSQSENFAMDWQELLQKKRNTITLRFSLPIPSPISSDDNRNSQLSLLASVLQGKFFDDSIIILAFIEDLSNKETLYMTDQHYTESLEQLVNETNRELEEIQKQLIRSEKKVAMTETAGAIAHELRQPLTAILGAIELINTVPRDTTADSHLDKLLATISKQCLRMADIIEKMEQLVAYKTRPYIKGQKIIDLDESSQKRDRRDN